MKSLFLVIALITLASCSTAQKQKEIRIEAAQESTASDSKTLGATIHDLIESSTTLTPADKKELKAIIAKNKEIAEYLTEQSFKFRTVLIKELFSGKIDYKKVSLIKKDIKKIEAQRLKNTFETIEKITAIISKNPDFEKYQEHLIKLESPASQR